VNSISDLWMRVKVYFGWEIFQNISRNKIPDVLLHMYVKLHWKWFVSKPLCFCCCSESDTGFKQISFLSFLTLQFVCLPLIDSSRPEWDFGCETYYAQNVILLLFTRNFFKTLWNNFAHVYKVDISTFPKQGGTWRTLHAKKEEYDLRKRFEV
jgi:hypothetical protein